MAKIDKLIAKLLSNPTDFTWEELTKILNHFGFIELKKGKTGGSRRKFADKSNIIISLHKPHPGNILKHYQIRDVVTVLKERGKIKHE
jgi:HicA toxin of bacterial toxin-antitoxin,